MGHTQGRPSRLFVIGTQGDTTIGAGGGATSPAEAPLPLLTPVVARYGDTFRIPRIFGRPPGEIVTEDHWTSVPQTLGIVISSSCRPASGSYHVSVHELWKAPDLSGKASESQRFRRRFRAACFSRHSMQRAMECSAIGRSPH